MFWHSARPMVSVYGVTLDPGGAARFVSCLNLH